ncbi:MAG: hypothetical protein M1836_001863 [Candelina mexicana]|nr:MAG: hypothetical protein M1836_001863 [Candelina mexicana]
MSNPSKISRGRHTRTSLVAALQKDRISTFRDALDRAKITVMLANQDFTNMLQLHSMDMLCRAAKVLQNSQSEPFAETPPVPYTTTQGRGLKFPVKSRPSTSEASGRGLAISKLWEASELVMVPCGDSRKSTVDAAQTGRLVTKDNLLEALTGTEAAKTFHPVVPQEERVKTNGLDQENAMPLCARGDLVNLKRQSAQYIYNGKSAVDSFETIRALVQYGHVDPTIDETSGRAAVDYMHEEFEVEFNRRDGYGYTTLMNHAAGWYLAEGQKIDLLTEIGADVNEK